MNNATLLTVTGPISIDEVTVADAHAHVWIDPPDGVAPEVRIELRDRPRIAAEVRAFGEAGGRLIVDCQPEGCGRNAACLAELSAETGVFITATTGFHQRKFYPEGHWLWRSDAETAARFFRGELTRGMRETGGAIPATTIKVGYEGTIDGQTRVLMEAAADAAHALYFVPRELPERHLAHLNREAALHPQPLGEALVRGDPAGVRLAIRGLRRRVGQVRRRRQRAGNAPVGHGQVHVGLLRRGRQAGEQEECDQGERSMHQVLLLSTAVPMRRPDEWPGAPGPAGVGTPTDRTDQRPIG